MKLGVIGCGFRAQIMLKALARQNAQFEEILVLDVVPDAALCRARESGIRAAHFTSCTDLDDFFGKGPDGVVIATNCDTHTEYAIRTMDHQLPMFLEKPVCTTWKQLSRLQAAAKRYTRQAMVSFPLRGTPLCLRAKAILDSGQLGMIQHVQAVNNVPYGGVYYHDWYRNEAITGGLFLQKATHDVDYITFLLGMQPMELTAMESKTVFCGDKPAGLKCVSCPENRSCDESPFVLENRYNREPTLSLIHI